MKKTIHHSLEANDLETIVALAKENRKVLSLLVRAAYDKKTLVGWRAIRAVGLAAQELVKTDYEFLRELVRKLRWSLSDESGGIGWSAPELLGEIVSADPQRFSDIVPLIAEVYDIEEDVFRPGVLYALGRVAQADPALVVSYKDLIKRALSDGNPLTRVYALDLLKTLRGRLGENDKDIFNKMVINLLSDHSETWVYIHDRFVNMEVREAARQLLM